MRRGQRPEPVGRLECRELPDGANAHRGIGVAQLARQLALPLESRGDVLDAHDQADRALVVAERADDDALLHPVELLGWFERRAGDEELVQRRRQHLRRAGDERLAQQLR